MMVRAAWEIIVAAKFQNERPTWRNGHEIRAERATFLNGYETTVEETLKCTTRTLDELPSPYQRMVTLVGRFGVTA
jgi:hypothetical protein